MDISIFGNGYLGWSEVLAWRGGSQRDMHRVATVRVPNFVEMATLMHDKVILDGRTLYQALKLRTKGWNYYPVGRAATDRD